MQFCYTTSFVGFYEDHPHSAFKLLCVSLKKKANLFLNIAAVLSEDAEGCNLESWHVPTSPVPPQNPTPASPLLPA